MALVYLLRPWEWHFHLEAVCPSHKVATLIIKIIGIFLLAPFTYSIPLLSSFEYSSFTGNLPALKPQLFAYPKWMLLLSCFMLSNHTWTQWMSQMGRPVY
jgi:hypothetical protein